MRDLILMRVLNIMLIIFNSTQVITCNKLTLINPVLKRLINKDEYFKYNAHDIYIINTSDNL